MKLLIVVGGGGHFAPALAVIENLPKDVEVMLVGRKYSLEGDSALSLEYQTAKKLNINFRSITTGRFQRTFTKLTLTSILKIPIGVYQSIKILRDYSPDVVLSFGGYVSVPIILVSRFMNIPIVIHEQILGAGAANKFASIFAQKVCVSWESSMSQFPKAKTILTGNPVRRGGIKNSILEIDKKRLPLIFITGGSSGAHSINQLVEGCLESLLKKYYVIHQTGDASKYGDFERLNMLRSTWDPELRKRYLLKKFVEPNAFFDILKVADLVVGRSGINTVTELLYFGVPSILIPLPYGQKNEQQANARFLEKIGLAVSYDQKMLTSDLLYSAVLKVFANINQFRINIQKGRKMINDNSADKIIEAVRNAKNK